MTFCPRLNHPSTLPHRSRILVGFGDASGGRGDARDTSADIGDFEQNGPS